MALKLRENKYQRGKVENITEDVIGKQKDNVITMKRSLNGAKGEATKFAKKVVFALSQKMGKHVPLILYANKLYNVDAVNFFLSIHFILCFFFVYTTAPTPTNYHQ